MNDGELTETVERLLGGVATAGRDGPQRHARLRSLERLDGGRNNRVYRAVTDAAPMFVKVYYRSADDDRDRLGAEIAFATLAAERCPGRVAAARAWDGRAGVALFDFCEGRRLRAGDVDDARVDEALSFLAALNRADDARSVPAGVSVPLAQASEACFSMGAHLEAVGRRVERLGRIATDAEAPASDADTAAVALVRERIHPRWQGVREQAQAAVARESLDIDEVLPEPARCNSPSDFGFHNALITADGSLLFHDFEYAGRDDPAKLVCDCLCQPELPLDAARAARFLEGAVTALDMDDAARARAAILLPVYRIKWCCIVLAEFVAFDSPRRVFAAREAPADRSREETKLAQLAKAERMLGQLG